MNNSTANENDYKKITYVFTFSDGSKKQFDIELDEKLNLVIDRREEYPEWTRLENFRCPVCKLDDSQHEYCPIITSLYEIIEYFKDSVSTEQVEVEIITDERSYKKTTALQNGLNSLVGIFMSTGGCPTLEKLKPAARFHLPFATVEESSFRIISMYLFAQYFINKNGGNPDWKMKKLVDIYDGIRIINRYFCERLSDIKVQDATINALITLDCFAFSISYFIDKDRLEKIEGLFEPYVRDSKYGNK